MLTKFLKLAAETTQRKTKRGRKRKLQPAMTGEKQAVAVEGTEIEQATEATEEEVTAANSEDEDEEREEEEGSGRGPGGLSD